MKKVLIFSLLIAFSVLCGVGYALASEAIMESASAVSYTMVVDSGVVRPDLLPGGYANITHLSDSLTPSQALALDDGYYYTGSGTAGILQGGAAGATFCNLSAGSYLYVVFSFDSAGYYSFTTMYENSYSGSFLSCYYVNSSSFSQWNSLNIGADVFVGQNFVSFWSSYQTGVNKFVFMIYRSDYSISFVNAKVEKVPNYPQTRQSSFSGFILPGTTYDDGGTIPDEPVDPEVDPYENWDGVVRANLLRNSSDFENTNYWTKTFTSATIEVSNGKLDLKPYVSDYSFSNTSTRRYYDEDTFLTVSLYVDSLYGDGDATLSVSNVSATLISESNTLTTGINYFVYQLDAGGEPRLSINLTSGTGLVFSWAKMELGSLFTGYVTNLDDYYNYAYRQGYLAAVNETSVSSLETTAEYDTTSHTYSGSIGWRDFGINNALELTYYSWSLISYYFLEKDYPVLYSDFSVNVDYPNDYSLTYVTITISNSLTPSNDTANITVVLYGNDYIARFQDHNYFPPVSDIPYDPTDNPDWYKLNISCKVNNEVYIEGVRSAAEAVGYDNGYTDGYDTGYTDGERTGFNDGVVHSNDYSWRGLFSALIGVPISAIMSVFNFEILGFNMLNLLQTVVMVSLFLFVIKSILGKVH